MCSIMRDRQHITTRVIYSIVMDMGKLILRGKLTGRAAQNKRDGK